MKSSEHCLEVTYPERKDVTRIVSKYVGNRIIKITLHGDEEGDQSKLESVQLEIRRLLRSGDLKAGIEITFTDGAKYSSLIRLLDLCTIEGAKMYMHYENKFWIFNHRKYNH